MVFVLPGQLPAVTSPLCPRHPALPASAPRLALRPQLPGPRALISGLSVAHAGRVKPSSEVGNDGPGPKLREA